MRVPDVVYAISVEIEIAAAVAVFDPDTFDMANGGQTRRRDALVEEDSGVAVDQATAIWANGRAGPGSPARR
jgi:hypothetical protein